MIRQINLHMNVQICMLSYSGKKERNNSYKYTKKRLFEENTHENN